MTKLTIRSTKKSMNNYHADLVARYYVEIEKKEDNIPYDKDLIKSLRSKLEEEGILEKAIEFTKRSREASKALKNGASIEEVIKIQTGRER